jgi:hypothetical protein
MAALKTGMVSAHEARIAAALHLDPELSGLRDLEVASGLCDDTILKVLPAEGESSTLLERLEQGVFTWESGDRRPMVVGHRSFIEHNPSISSKPSKGQETLKTPKGSEGSKEREGDYARRMTGVLDPSKDLWANGTQTGLGDHGWVLAMVTKLRATTFTLDELKGILRLGERQLRRVLDKMGSYVRRVKEGRRALVTVDFSWLMTDPEVLEDHGLTQKDLGLGTRRRDDKAARMSYEADVVREMASEAGQIARTMWNNRVAEVKQLREYGALLGRKYDDLIRILEGSCRWRAQRALRKLLA